MNRTKKTAAQRRDDAMAKAEDAICELICVASRIAKFESNPSESLFDVQRRRMDLMKCARRYTRAMDALSRLHS